MENDFLKPEKWFRSVTLKLFVLGFLSLVLLIPLAMIRDVIKERETNAETARTETGKLWAEAQTLTGPVLNVPGKKIVSDDGKYVTGTLHILPSELRISGDLRPELRYRGIYETVVYDSDLDIAGSFDVSGLDGYDGYVYDWSQAYFSVGVTDNRGIRDEVTLSVGGVSVEARPGAGQDEVFAKGISFPLAVDPSSFEGEKAAFSLRLGLKGSGSVSFSPVGKVTDVKLGSTWSSPSFTGNFLPATRDVTDAGFTASWTVTHLNRSFPQVWTGSSYDPSADSFGVEMMLEAGHYAKAERSAKYGVLFIVITFFVLIIVELRSSQRIHLFYYLMSAFALILFFSLLTALSEQIGFNAAYLVSSASIIALLSLFFRSLLGDGRLVLVIGGLLTVLYVFVFVLLALKDYAFLAGNIGLFVMLAVLMLVSSKYRLFNE